MGGPPKESHSKNTDLEEHSDQDFQKLGAPVSGPKYFGHMLVAQILWAHIYIYNIEKPFFGNHHMISFRVGSYLQQHREVSHTGLGCREV